MSKEIDWSRAPEGATHYHPHINGYVEHWVKPGYFCTLGFEESGWRYSTNMIRDTSALISRPSPWNGAELPPVGTVRECSHNDKHGNRVKWKEVKVVAYHEDEDGTLFAICTGKPG